MKNLLFIAAFLLASTFSFASTATKSVVTPKATQTTVKKEVKTIGNFKFTKVEKKDVKMVDGSFYYIDSCGNLWYVEYWGMSDGDARDIVWALDPFLCYVAS